MNCRKYRLCLAGVIVFALVVGVFFYVKNVYTPAPPQNGTLVQEWENDKDCGEVWA